MAGTAVDVPTNPVLELSGASNYVANMMLGFGAMNTMHSATRIYHWYPADTMTLKLKIQNLRDESVVIARNGVVVFEEKPGTGLSLDFQWTM